MLPFWLVTGIIIDELSRQHESFSAKDDSQSTMGNHKAVTCADCSVFLTCCYPTDYVFIPHVRRRP